MQEVSSPKIQVKLILKIKDVAVLSRLASKEGLTLKAFILKRLVELVANFASGK